MPYIHLRPSPVAPASWHQAGSNRLTAKCCARCVDSLKGLKHEALLWRERALQVVRQNSLFMRQQLLRSEVGGSLCSRSQSLGYPYGSTRWVIVYELWFGSTRVAADLRVDVKPTPMPSRGRRCGVQEWRPLTCDPHLAGVLARWQAGQETSWEAWAWARWAWGR